MVQLPIGIVSLIGLKIKCVLKFKDFPARSQL
jgi:hypothetical protein